MCGRFGLNNYCHQLIKVAQSAINRPIWSHCRRATSNDSATLSTTRDTFWTVNFLDPFNDANQPLKTPATTITSMALTTQFMRTFVKYLLDFKAGFCSMIHLYIKGRVNNTA